MYLLCFCAPLFALAYNKKLPSFIGLVRHPCRAALIGVLAITQLGSTGCLVRRRKLDRVAHTSAPLLVAGLDQLDEILKQRFEALETLDATVDLEPAVLSASRGEIAEYKDVRGYILLRKPGWIRVIGLYPVVRATAFDMASDGQNFRLYLPSQNLFLEGLNRLVKPSPKRFENLRPEALLDALLIRPPDPPTERAVIENWAENGTASYIVHVVRRESPGGQLWLVRNVWFDRSTLEIVRQQTFDEKGDVVTDARYSTWERQGGVVFPKRIVITRPRDEYELSISFEKLLFNQPIALEKFELLPPAGVKVRRVGEGAEQAGGSGGG